MKKLMIAVMLFVAGSCPAQADDIQNLKNWVLSQPIKIGTAVDLKGEVRGVSYLALGSIGQAGWGLGDAAALEYVSLNAGVDFDAKSAKFLAIPMCRPHNIGSALWRRLPQLVQSRVQRLILPNIEIGLGANLPRPGEAWVVGKEIRGVVAYRF